jgi:SAM-dependent methyltransferase
MSYTKHIFDFKNKVPIRNFEDAYKTNKNVYPSQFNVDSLKHDIVKRVTFSASIKSPRILDVGAGYGVFTNVFFEKGFDVIGIEVSPSAVKHGKEIFGEALPLFVGDVEALTFKDNDFDAIICYGLIGYLLDKSTSVLTELKRVLKPGGSLFISMGYNEENKIFQDVVAGEKDFLDLLKAYFNVQQFFVDYCEIQNEEKRKNLDIHNQQRDFIAICKKAEINV